MNFFVAVLLRQAIRLFDQCEMQAYYNSEKQESLAIAKMTARCAQYISALKIVYKHKISRRLHKNLHITILSLFGGEIIFEMFQPIWSGYLNVTNGQTDGRYTEASPRGKTRETKCRRYYRYRRYSKTDHGPSLRVNAHRPLHARGPRACSGRNETSFWNPRRHKVYTRAHIKF